jgi:hypothetical protein
MQFLCNCCYIEMIAVFHEVISELGKQNAMQLNIAKIK